MAKDPAPPVSVPDDWDPPRPERDQLTIETVPQAKVGKVRGARRSPNR